MAKKKGGRVTAKGTRPSNDKRTSTPDIMSTISALQANVEAAQAEVATQVVTGSAGGGMVEVDLRGDGHPVAVRINAQVVDADDVDTLEDLVLAALRSAATEVSELRDGAVSDATGGLDIDDITSMLG